MGLPNDTRLAHDAHPGGEPPALGDRRYSSAVLQASLDPVADAAAWLDHALQGQATPSVLAVIGLGHGHLLDVLEAQAPDVRLIVLEPDPSLAVQVLSRRDWIHWRTSGRLLYLAGPDYAGASEAWRLFPTGRSGDYRVLVHPALAEDAGPDAVAAARTLKRILSGAKANADARRAFAPRYLTNTLANLIPIVTQGDVSALDRGAEGLPAILVAAGPSLDENLEALRHVGDRAVVIAVDTAYRPLRAAGIEPHFVVALDPSEANARHLLGVTPSEATLLVAEGSIDPRVCDTFQSIFFFQVSEHEPWPWLVRHGVGRSRLAAWGSVLTTALDLARRLGCDPVIFVGADLAFTDDRPYCRGTVYEEGWHSSRERGYDQRFTWRSEIEARNPIDVLDLHGHPTQSTAALEAFRDWLVEQTRRPPKRQFINATGAGILFGGHFQQRRLGDIALGPAVDTLRERFRACCVQRSLADAAPILSRLAADLEALGRTDLGRRWREFTTLPDTELHRVVAREADRLCTGGRLGEADERQLA